MKTNLRIATAVETQPAPLAACPLCHTVEASVSDAALAGGATWRCQRCGQRWDARRLDIAAAYAATV